MAALAALFGVGKAPVGVDLVFPVLVAVRVAADGWGVCFPALYLANDTGKKIRPVAEYNGYTSFSPAYAGEKSVVTQENRSERSHFCCPHCSFQLGEPFVA